MSRHTEATPSEPIDGAKLPGKARSIARFFGRETGRRRPVSIETDARLRAAHVRAAAFRPELY